MLQPPRWNFSHILFKYFHIFLLINLVNCTNLYAGAIITDGSVGPASSLIGPNYVIPQNIGTTIGNNLFHSFKTFQLNQNDVAEFSGANHMQNIISRVTGGEISKLDGTIRSKIGNANFFFINAAGVIFGEHAQIDVPAAFHVSTAHELNFQDGTRYQLVTPTGDTLTAAPP